MRTASAQAMEIVKATAPVIEQRGLEITTAMYARLFQNDEVKAMFDQAAQESGEQPRRLAAAILAYAKNIDKLGDPGTLQRLLQAFGLGAEDISIDNLLREPLVVDVKPKRRDNTRTASAR